MDQTHNFPGEPIRGRKNRSKFVGPAAAPTDELLGNVENALNPISEKWDSQPELGKWRADTHLGSGDPVTDWVIQGWLAATGTSVWYGAGSTGKTQLMLWMAAMIASRPEDRHEHTWLGARVRKTGAVLILTAEDTREQIMMRLRDVVTVSMKQVGATRQRTCERLHVMPFLSMSEAEFKHSNPSLLQQNKERVWEPSDVLAEIRRYIQEWNRLHPDDEDRIVGVVMDSATSMSGFDSLDAQATTNFFFYLGRLCERLRLFWAVIGHTPKVTAIPRHTARETAPSRLRGVAMWTTAPRLTVEVRLIQEWKRGKFTDCEEPDLRKWLGAHWKKENILVVYVAKANLQHAVREERYLVRLKQGAFVDVTGMPDDVLHSGVLDPDPDELACEIEASIRSEYVVTDPAVPSISARPARRTAGRPVRSPVDYGPGTDLVLELLLVAYPDVGTDAQISANRVFGLVSGIKAGDQRAKFVTSASGGNVRTARIGAINWHLDQLVEKGLLTRRGRSYVRSTAGRVEA